MSKQLDFYFDFGSPTTYLAHCRLKQLSDQYDLQVAYKPILLGGLFKATANTSPVAIPAKGSYMMQHDLPRFAKRYNVPLNMNPHFPINTLKVMRGAIAANHLGGLATYCEAMFQAIWVDAKNLGELDVIASVITDAGLDAGQLMELSQTPDVKAELISATEAAVERGAFGAPLMFMDDEMYFGQDRLDFVEEALQ
jgi:2-hydroxychromene-2-carboxylate isomerase